MKKIIIILSLLLITIGALITLNSITLTGKSILNHYSHTMAICNDNNFCEDYEIHCEGNMVKKIKPTGFFIQHEKSWTDPRNKVAYCEN